MTPAEVVALAAAAVLVLAGAGYGLRRAFARPVHHRKATGATVRPATPAEARPAEEAPRRWPAAAYQPKDADPPTGPIRLPTPLPPVADDRRADAGPPPGTAERRRVDLGPGGRHRREDVTGELSATSILRRLNAGDSPDTALGR